MYIRVHESKTYYSNVMHTTVVVKYYSIVRPAYTLIVYVLYMLACFFLSSFSSLIYVLYIAVDKCI